MRTASGLLAAFSVVLACGKNPPTADVCSGTSAVYESNRFAVADEDMGTQVLSTSFTPAQTVTICRIAVLLKNCGTCSTTSSRGCSSDNDCAPSSCPTCVLGETCGTTQPVVLNVWDLKEAPTTTYGSATRIVSPVGWFTYILASPERFTANGGQRYFVNLQTGLNSCKWTLGEPNNPQTEFGYINGQQHVSEFEFTVRGAS